MKKAMILFFAICVAFAAYAGGGADTASPAAKEPVTLQFMNWGIVEASTKPAFEAFSRAFTEKYPHIKIEHVGYPYNQMKDQMLLMAASRRTPDIAQMAPIWLAAVNELGALEPLDPLVLNKADYDENALAGSVFSGKLVSVPWALNPVILFYNKTLLARAGYTNPPRNYPEMIQMARKVGALGADETGNKIYGLSIASKRLPNAGYFFFPNIWQNGGEIIDKSGKIVLNQPGTVRAFKEAQDLFRSEVVPAGMEIKDERSLFAQGRLAFHFDVINMIKVFQDTSPKGADFRKEFDILRIPGATGPEGLTFSSDHNLVMFSNSKHKAEAALFMDFLTGPEGMKIYNELEGNKIPARKSVFKLDYYAKPEVSYLKVVIDAMPGSRPLMVQNAEFLKACEELAEGIVRVGIAFEDPAKVVQDLDSKLRMLYKQ